MKADEQEVHDNFAALKNILHDTQKELATIKYECAHINARAFKAETEYATLLEYCRELENEKALLTAQVAMQVEALEIASDYLPQHWDMNSTPLLKIEEALSATAETVAAWKQENDAKVLEDMVIESDNGFRSELFKVLQRRAAELRVIKEKERLK